MSNISDGDDYKTLQKYFFVAAGADVGSPAGSRPADDGWLHGPPWLAVDLHNRGRNDNGLCPHPLEPAGKVAQCGLVSQPQGAALVGCKAAGSARTGPFQEPPCWHKAR